MRTRLLGILLTSIAAVAAYAATPPAHVSYTVAPTWKSGTYAYDAAGNIIAIGGDRYVYDELNRLYDANLEEALDRKGQRYTYDAFGNLTKVEYTANGAVTRARAQNVDPNLTNQLTNVVDNGTTTAFTYDAAGNVQRAGSVQYTYDAAGTMTGVAASQQSEFYVYTADGERIASVDLAVGNPGSWTMVHWRLRDLGAHVVRELDEYPSNGTWTWSRDYVYRGGSLLSSFVNNGTSEVRQDYHLDHLGSPRLITDEQGYRVAQHDFFPYGEEVNPPPLDSDALKFTGHERDTGTSSEPSPANYLDYMHARYYGTVSGRFLSVDPVNGNANSLQSWNRYVYASNTPIDRVDPDGRLDRDACKDGKCDHVLVAKVQVGTPDFKIAGALSGGVKVEIDPVEGDIKGTAEVHAGSEVKLRGTNIKKEVALNAVKVEYSLKENEVTVKPVTSEVAVQVGKLGATVSSTEVSVTLPIAGPVVGVTIGFNPTAVAKRVEDFGKATVSFGKMMYSAFSVAPEQTASPGVNPFGGFTGH